MMVEVVLWDFGGVIMLSLFEVFNIFEEVNGLLCDFICVINVINLDDNVWVFFEWSEIMFDVFDVRFCEEVIVVGYDVGGK